MFSLLLGIIYLAFISLGLPDSLIGAGWPVMHTELQVSVASAGILTMIIAANTIISSLLSARLTQKLGTGLLTALSVLLTAVALMGFATANSFSNLCWWAIPYGLGAGAVDAALNNFVALHYAARQMNWLHCFWGVGAAISPYIMSASLTHHLGWRSGYQMVGALQIGLAIILFLSLPLWRRQTDRLPATHDSHPPLSFTALWQLNGVKTVLIAFFAYCAVESTCGLWASSFLVQFRHVNSATAAQFASLFYIGITLGRFLAGVFANHFGDHALVRIGIFTMLIGIFFLLIPLNTTLALIGLVIIGFGCAPIYPAILHATPDNFGATNSQAIIGVQMAAAYVGTTLMPPLFGVIGKQFGFGWYPWFLLGFTFILLASSERVRQLVGAASTN